MAKSAKKGGGKRRQSVGAIEAAGGLVAALGVLLDPTNSGNTIPEEISGGNLPGAWNVFVDNIESPILGLVGKGNSQAAYEDVWGGVLVAVGGKILGKIFPSLKRTGIKIGNDYRLRIA